MMKSLLLPVLFTVLSLSAPRWLVAADPSAAPTPPEWIKPAFDRGLVTLEFYDQTKEPREYPGWTIFDSDLTYQFDYEYRFREDRPKKYVVTLLPKFSKVEGSTGDPGRSVLELRKTVEVEMTAWQGAA